LGPSKRFKKIIKKKKQIKREIWEKKLLL